MDIYHNKSIHGFGGSGCKLTPLPVSQTFLWENQEIFIPTVYVGKAGAVLDICAKIPTEDMAAFLKKWNRKRRQELENPTAEELEQITAENPACRDFSIEMGLDGTMLSCGMGSGLHWCPPNLFQLLDDIPNGDRPTHEQENCKTAEELMKAYGRDRECIWHFKRLSYNWNGAPILSPQNISLLFQADTLSITAGYFSTDSACGNYDKETVKVLHPITGQEYTITPQGCRQSSVSFDALRETHMIYPNYYQELSYSISPGTEQGLIDILDCATGDAPKPVGTPEGCDAPNGATSFFIAGKSASPDFQAAVSSLHFKPVPTVRWRIVFLIKPKENMEVHFPVQVQPHFLFNL